MWVGTALSADWLRPYALVRVYVDGEQAAEEPAMAEAPALQLIRAAAIHAEAPDANPLPFIAK
jgi:hypothetical protein